MTGSLHGRRSAGKQKDREQGNTECLNGWMQLHLDVQWEGGCGARMGHSLRGEQDAGLQAAVRVRAGSVSSRRAQQRRVWWGLGEETWPRC